MDQENNIFVDIHFSDSTLNEVDGFYKEVCKLMNKENKGSNKQWCIKSRISIESDYGIAAMVANFLHNGNIIIVDFFPSTLDMYANIDIPSFSRWMSERNWKNLCVSDFIVKEHFEFWKHFWNSKLIENDYLNKTLLIRKR